MVVEDFNEFGIHSFREKRIGLKRAADLIHVETVEMLEHYHAMRVAHIYARNVVFDAVYGVFLTDYPAFCLSGYLFCVKFGRAHIYGDISRLSLFGLDAYLFKARYRLNGEFAFTDDIVIVKIFRYASYAVARHFAFGTVEVEHSHLSVRAL